MCLLTSMHINMTWIVFDACWVRAIKWLPRTKHLLFSYLVVSFSTHDSAFIPYPLCFVQPYLLYIDKYIQCYLHFKDIVGLHYNSTVYSLIGSGFVIFPNEAALSATWTITQLRAIIKLMESYNFTLVVFLCCHLKRTLRLQSSRRP